jgi:glycosyltransferase involved in cell wall biosynthesis
MKIAIHAKELEHSRVDGTRSYISALLQQWSSIADHDFYLYHGSKKFDPAYDVLRSENFHEKQSMDVPLWTQTVFAQAVWRDAPDVLWMPLHNLPRVRRADMETVVTIHDLAFKQFPHTFPSSSRRKLDFLTAYACAKANRIIAVSHATKNDILRYYPDTDPHKIAVVYHGVDRRVWHVSHEQSQEVLRKFGIVKPHIVFVGGLQPRKNIARLVEAFDDVRTKGHDLQLVLVGADAWLSGEIHQAQASSKYAEDIIMTGSLPHDEVVGLLQSAVVSAFIPLYEGFGLPILESFAARTPVLTGDHSSLGEVAGDAVHYCNVEDVASISAGIVRLVTDDVYAQDLVRKGESRVGQFTWGRCADETLSLLTGPF